MRKKQRSEKKLFLEEQRSYYCPFIFVSMVSETEQKVNKTMKSPNTKSQVVFLCFYSPSDEQLSPTQQFTADYATLFQEDIF